MDQLFRRLFKISPTVPVELGEEAFEEELWAPIADQVAITDDTVRIVLVKESHTGNKSLIFDSADTENDRVMIAGTSKNSLADMMLGAMPLAMQTDCLKVVKKV